MFCTGEEEKGLGYIEKASDMDHIAASYFLGDYYRKDRDFYSGGGFPKKQKHYDAAIFYYERTASLIENTSNYPVGAHQDVSGIEERHYISINTFLYLNRLYYGGYSRALGDMLRNDVSYTDTIEVLENLKKTAERCLERPSLSVWGHRQSEISNSKQVICQAREEFADKALELEFQRMEIAKHCVNALKECEEHKFIFNQIIQASNDMVRKMKTVPAI